MAVPPDPATDAFLQLVDALDLEANAVTHAVVRAQATVRSIVDDARMLLDHPDADERAWAELGVRLMQHRAALADALATLCRSGIGGAGSSGAAGPAPSPAGRGALVTAVSTPISPRPRPIPPAVAPQGPLAGPNPGVDRRSEGAAITVPRPPQPRERGVPASSRAG
jgi:hypothetical protein